MIIIIFEYLIRLISYINFNTYKNSMSLRIQRLQLVQNLTIADPVKYQFLTAEPFATRISSNYQQFPNDFLQALYDKIIQFEGYHIEVLKDDLTYGQKAKEFDAIYLQCCNDFVTQQQYMIYLEQQRQQQLQQNIYQNQHQQYSSQQYGQGQQSFNHQQNQFGGQNNHHYNKNYGGQYQQGHQSHQSLQGHQGQQGQQGQHGYNQGGYNQQGHRNYQYKQQYQANQDQAQGTNNQQRYQNNNNQNRNKQFNNNNRYNNQQGDYQQHQQGEHHYNRQNGHHYNNYQKGNSYNQYHQQFETEQAEPQAEVQQVVAPPPPPPKAEPKPMKFSLKEIRDFINEWSDKDKQIVNKELIQKVNEVNGWTKGETSFQQKPEKPQQDRKYDNRNRNNNNQNREQRERGTENQQQQQGFNTGSKFSRQQAMPQLVKKDTGLKIVVGKNETLEARMIKKEIRDKAGQDFATLIEKQNETLDRSSIAKKQIIYNLNLLAPENLKEIQKDLTGFLFESEEVCQILIQQIIEKAWGQPKYASTYAKLCSQFSKVGVEKFSFNTGKKDNPFKLYLISKVQHSFDKKVEQIPEFSNDEEKEAWLKETKKKILGNVKFIAELILSKVLKKKIMKICISQLIFTFLAKYYYYRESNKFVNSYYDYYFEALIEFIENVGDFYEKMDESADKKEGKKEEKSQTQAYEPAQKRILDLIEMNQKPPEEEIEEINNLKAEDYFKLFSLIDEKILRKKNTRLSALLLNLTERRSNGWQKHHAESEGPKKLKDIKEDIAKEQSEMNKVKQQKKASSQHLNDLVKALLKDWDSGERNQKTHFKNILREYDLVKFLTSCLNQVPDEKKDVIRKRLELFDSIFQNYFDLEKIKTAFFECIKYMAFNSGDYPYAGSAYALVLKKILSRQGAKLKEFYLKTDDEDEEFFINDVFSKLWGYTENKEIKELMQPNKKNNNMLDA